MPDTVQKKAEAEAPKPETAGTVDQSVAESEDIFVNSQTYVYVTIELSEPIFPLPEKHTIRNDATDLVRDYEDPPRFPSSQDAINEFQSAINYVVLQVAAEYQKVN